ncbi:Dihydrolipoamide dehydrogenase of pyruvate dehydrogenase complex [Staphylococcus aureus]|uniref:Dihydrolipoamide dehydrogenase of pyruvate dehydrogenase complex n=1 Tax=Staphylococcus aureus TaxID=1280 RepID=A0A2X2K0Q8_STAAU|nr:Dihydrolipoamide dehydrogenase of pyruvate dehydrogenase complex [Staphylococcus aureus]
MVKLLKLITLVCQPVCFTEPELATVGYSEAQAKEEGLAIKASKFPYAANGRALSLDDTNGFVKLITLKEDDTLIGAQVVGTGCIRYYL